MVDRRAFMCACGMNRCACVHACGVNRRACVCACGVNRHVCAPVGLNSRALEARLTGEKLIFFGDFNVFMFEMADLGLDLCGCR
jgi:hypothetical protein